jgi:hypothetical protein
MRKMPGLKRGTKHKMADYAKEHYDFPLTKKSEHKPLKGVRVIDAGNMVAAPFATVLLADFGADVIKIEHPKYGDGQRKLEPIMDGIPLWWKSVSRNKRCITLDLGKPEGADIFKQLIKGSDVIVEALSRNGASATTPSVPSICASSCCAFPASARPVRIRTAPASAGSPRR